MSRDATVRLGFARPTGDPVDIPIRHTCIAGQTQEAGKTTALEALIARSGLQALAFVTKPGEGAFTGGRRLDPYFREAVDWQFVASILEASRGEKMKFERAWIMRACRGAHTLADVQRNTRTEMVKARGLAADMFMMLDAYLEAVVPLIASVRWAPAIALGPGLNVMDLSGLPTDMQHLVIRSCVDWVLHREASTIVVIPEAWKFLPQGRGTPVKLAAEAFIRQAAARGNYLWLDSQDIGGIEKTILRSVAVWILGVQREANEIKRTLKNIPASPQKPKAQDLALLEIGQFYACWGRHVIPTYVWPRWLRADEAIAVAKGERRLDTPLVFLGEPVVFLEERELQREIDRTVFDDVHRMESRDVFDQLAAAPARRQGHTLTLTTTSMPDQGSAPPELPAEEANTMTADQERKLDAVVEGLTRLTATIAGGMSLSSSAGGCGAAGGGVLGLTDDGRTGGQGGAAGAGELVELPAATAADTEELYQSFKARLITDALTDPAILKLLVSQPQIRVEIERRTVTADGDSLSGRVARLVVDGWFDEVRGSTATAAEMAKRGWSHDYRHVDRAARTLAEKGFLRIEDGKFVSVRGMKAHITVVEA